MPTPSPIVAAEFTEIYVALIALISSKCASVSSSETSLVAACNDIKTGVVHLKAYVSSLDSVLPSRSELATLPRITLNSTTTPHPLSPLTSSRPTQDHAWEDAIIQGYELMKGAQNWSETPFEDDNLEASLYSPLSKATIERVITGRETPPGPVTQLIAVSFNILAQARATRTQLTTHFDMMKWTLAACLIPQLTLLLLLCLQFIINRRRQAKLKKKIRKAEESHEMIARIRGQNAWRENARFLEV